MPRQSNYLDTEFFGVAIYDLRSVQESDQSILQQHIEPLEVGLSPENQARSIYYSMMIYLSLLHRYISQLKKEKANCNTEYALSLIFTIFEYVNKIQMIRDRAAETSSQVPFNLKFFYYRSAHFKREIEGMQREWSSSIQSSAVTTTT